MPPFLAREDLGVMVMKGYSAFPKALASLEPDHQIVQCNIRTLVGIWGILPSTEKQSVYSTSPPSRLDNMTLCQANVSLRNDMCNLIKKKSKNYWIIYVLYHYLGYVASVQSAEKVTLYINTYKCFILIHTRRWTYIYIYIYIYIKVSLNNKDKLCIIYLRSLQVLWPVSQVQVGIGRGNSQNCTERLPTLHGPSSELPGHAKDVCFLKKVLKVYTTTKIWERRVG